MSVGKIRSVQVDIEEFKQVFATGGGADIQAIQNKVEALEALCAKQYVLTVKNSAAITADVQTAFSNLLLPEKVDVQLHTGAWQLIAVTWNEEGYDKNSTQSQVISGTLVLPEKVENLGGFTPTITVTLTSSSSTPDPGQTTIFDLKFMLTGTTEDSILLSAIDGWQDAYAFTGEDFYGANFDGQNKTVQVYFLGYEGNESYGPNGVPHPTSVETEAIATKISPDGAIDYDPDSKMLQFTNASSSARIYRIVKREG